MNARKVLPGYGKELVARRQRGLVPRNRTIAVVDHWDLGEQFRPWRVVVERDPGECDFSFVAGLGVVIIAATPQAVQALATAVRAYGPTEIVGAAVDPARIIPFALT